MDAKMVSHILIRKLRKLLSLLTLKGRDRVERVKSVYVERLDVGENSVRLSFFGNSNAGEISLLTARGERIALEDFTSCQTSRGIRNYFWVKFPDDNIFRMTFRGRTVNFVGSVLPDTGGELTLDACKSGAYHAEEQIKKLPAEVKILRSLISGPAAIQRFRGCWLMADRAHKADDNAEHFYRYVMNLADAPPIFFLLNVDSPDWERLEAEGFNLIPFGSYDHVAAVAHAAKVISSQATPIIRYPLPRRHIGDLCHADFVFLQHGIIINDCSSWINNHTYKYFVTSTPQEYTSLTRVDGPYNLTKRNTILTGLARHDSLFRARDDSRKNIIAITPTWRNYLAIKSPHQSMRYGYDRNLRNTSYAKQWGSLLWSPMLLDLILQTGFRVALLPHPNIIDYFRDCISSDHIYIPDEHISYQDIILRSAICLTDYSSVAMDMAAIDVPVVYFQFPEVELHSGKHTSRPGDFDYTKQGFGPVADNVDDVIAAMREILAGGGEDHVYRERRAETFSCCDGQACARLYEILRQSDQRRLLQDLPPTTQAGMAVERLVDRYVVNAR